MPIEPFPNPATRRRWWATGAFFLLAGGAVAACAAEVPAELAAALQTFRSDVPPGWSYTLTTVAEGRSTVEFCDATKPEFTRWSLRSKDGRSPTAEETQEYLEGRSRRSRGGTAPKITDQLDLAGVEEVASEPERITFRCRLRPGEGGDNVAGFLRATVIVHRASHTIEMIELHNTGPFSPTLGVNIKEMKTRMTYSLPTSATPSLPQAVATRVRGTAFWFKSLDAEMTVSFGDYFYVRRR